ncbi:hypothetical protein SMD22_01230 (plasmid) [Brevibacillus halotolerans]|nr:hypothetical protein SMD22_01230 [Brevibacillus halotolerans]
MSEHKMEFISFQIKEVEEYIRNSEDSYDDLYEHVESKLDELCNYAKEHNIPFVADIDELIKRNRDESEGYEEEDSSSYYEEDDSDYIDEED